MREIDFQTKALYAELLDQMQALEALKTVADLKGSFLVRKNNGKDYVYFQHYAIGGHLEQVYVGKLDDKAERLMRDHAEGKTDVHAARENSRRLALQISAVRGMATDKSMARVIQGLAEAGVFKLGGVLVGTHAYKTIGIMLGVLWTSDTMATLDIDIAAPRSVSVAIPMITADIPAAIDSLKMGFIPVPAMDLKQHSTSFMVRRSSLRLDLLTPKTTKSSAPVVIPRFNCAAMPLDYLSFLIESPVEAVLVDSTPVLVNVPQPARYALHKLIISQVRDSSRNTKSDKDLHQAYQLLSLLHTIRPDDIQLAWENLIGRGPKWKKPVEKGMAAMERRFGKLGG
jgi:hypothetical protein